MEAAIEDQEEVIVLLLQNGALPNLKDEQGKTALDYAQENKHIRISALLKNASKINNTANKTPE